MTRKRAAVCISVNDGVGSSAPWFVGGLSSNDPNRLVGEEPFEDQSPYPGDRDGLSTGRHPFPGVQPTSARDPGEGPSIRVLIADDHPIYLEGLAALINRQPGMVVVAQAPDGREAVSAFSRVSPDVGLIDLRMPGLDGVETITAIRRHNPMARLVIFSSFTIDEEIYRALRAGAKGYLPKDLTSGDVVDCVREVHAGRTCIPPAIALKLADRVTTTELTAREREVLGLVAKGMGNRDIGTRLTVTEGTVKVHVNNILAKLGVASRTEAVTLAFRRGLVRLED